MIQPNQYNYMVDSNQYQKLLQLQVGLYNSDICILKQEPPVYRMVTKMWIGLSKQLCYGLQYRKTSNLLRLHISEIRNHLHNLLQYMSVLLLLTEQRMLLKSILILSSVLILIYFIYPSILTELDSNILINWWNSRFLNLLK